jgi:hypothetical protein
MQFNYLGKVDICCSRREHIMFCTSLLRYRMNIPSPLQNAHPFSVAERSSLLRCRTLIPSPLQNDHPFSVAECSSLLGCRMLIPSPVQNAHLFSVAECTSLFRTRLRQLNFFQQVLVRHLACRQREIQRKYTALASYLYFILVDGRVM